MSNEAIDKQLEYIRKVQEMYINSMAVPLGISDVMYSTKIPNFSIGLSANIFMHKKNSLSMERLTNSRS